MAVITCAKCGAESPALEKPPLPGKIGLVVKERVCARCWSEWLGVQVRVINEYRLVPADPQHFDYLVGQMKQYLGLEGD
mgnify:CR=1 FL=1